MHTNLLYNYTAEREVQQYNYIVDWCASRETQSLHSWRPPLGNEHLKLDASSAHQSILLNGTIQLSLDYPNTWRPHLIRMAEIFGYRIAGNFREVLISLFSLWRAPKRK